MRKEIRADAGFSVRPFDRSQVPAVLEMLDRCSRTTRFRRFHGYSDGRPHVQDLVAGSDHRSVTGWFGGRCIGLATLAPGTVGHDLGVVIEDEWQRHGVGTRLVDVLVARARREGVHHINADLLYDTSFALRLLRRAGPVQSSLDWGVWRATLTLDGPRAAGGAT
jgi:GNAT superfamily N-acetyltransferase